MTRNFDNILSRYIELLAGIDRWFNRCQSTFPAEIRCGQGCSGCCRGLFDVTLLDAWLVRHGFLQLNPESQERIRLAAEARVNAMRSHWPEFSPPYILNGRPDDEWELLMPDDDETPCVFLDDSGRCLIYEHRPMTCRLHGLPLVDLSGEVMHEEWCTENFVASDPLKISGLRGHFISQFRTEVSFMVELTTELFGHGVGELDTFIPLAVLVDYDRFDWRGWRQQSVLIENGPLT